VRQVRRQRRRGALRKQRSSDRRSDQQEKILHAESLVTINGAAQVANGCSRVNTVRHCKLQQRRFTGQRLRLECGNALPLSHEAQNVRPDGSPQFLCSTSK
jgi:hypothetical protein